MASLDPLTAGLHAVKELTQAIREWAGGAPTRKMKRAIEYGERYIRLNSGIVKENRLPTKKEVKDLQEIEEDFFKNN